MKIAFILNGHEMELDVAADRRAVDLLREDLGLTGTKEGCGTGECGACTVLVDGETRLSCLMLASQLDGRRLTTIEGLAANPAQLHPVQEAFVQHGAVQCGFCTPGMVITATDFLRRHQQPDRQAMAEAIGGNICRCTGYQKIIEAMAAVEPEDLRREEAPVLPPPTLAAPRAVPARRQVLWPQSLEELWPLIARYPEAKILAGGTDLLVWLRHRRLDPAVLISLEKIAALKGIEEDAEAVRIGACTSHASLQAEPVVAALFPVLTKALATLGSPHIRRMGTIGGNIVTASPAGDTLPPLYVLGAKVELQSAAGKRTIALADFILGPGRTALRPGEILAAILLAKPAAGVIQHFDKVGLRQAMACAVASLAALIEISAAGRIAAARLAWGSVGPTVMRVPAAEAALVGRPLDRQTLEAVLPLVREGLAPIDDVRASGEYRRHIAGNLLLRLLQYPSSAEAATGAAGGGKTFE